MATTIQFPAAGLTGTATFPRPLIGSAILFLSDTIALLGAMLLAVAAWTAVVRPAPMEASAPYFAAIATALIAYAAQNLYGAFGMAETEQLRKIIATTTFVYLIITAALFLSKQSTSQSRGVIVCSWMLSLLSVPLLRAAVIAAVSRRGWWGHPAIIVGGGGAAAGLLRLFLAHPALGIKPVAVVDTVDGSEIEGVPVLADMDEAEEYARRWRIDHAVVLEPGRDAQALLDRCAARFANVLVIPQLGAETSLWISPKDLGGTLGLEIRHNLLVPLNRCLKRALDLAVALAAGTIAVPTVALAALWICCVSPGSPFFTQRRRSSQGGFFRVYKLRTMYPNADMMLLQYLERSSDASAQWQRDFKLKDDPRILPGIGKLLRKTSLDELPQLWNILRGEMSAVGPRPIVAAEVARYGASFDIVQRVKPGLTGLWQVSGRNDVSYEDRVRLDAYYVRNWSIWLDITILARTVQVLIGRKGAY